MGERILEIIDALEHGGPNLALEGDIFWMARRKSAEVIFWNAATGVPHALGDTIPAGLGRLAVLKFSPKYTCSLDDALTLVPEGMEWSISTLHGIADVEIGLNSSLSDAPWRGRRDDGNVPIAICIAALKARAASVSP